MTTTSPADDNEPDKLDPESARIIAEAEARRKLAQEENELRREMEGAPSVADVYAQIDAYKWTEQDEAAALERERAAKARRLQKRMERAKLPDLHLSKLSTGVVDESGKFGDIRRRAESKLGKGVIMALIGTRGTGKTQLATVLATNVIAAGRSALYITAHDVFSSIRGSYREDSRKSERDILDELYAPGLLIVDAIVAPGKDDKGWSANMLTAIVDKRYRDGSDTILLSNLTPAAFRETVGPDIEDRLREGGGIAVLDGESRRKS